MDDPVEDYVSKMTHEQKIKVWVAVKYAIARNLTIILPSGCREYYNELIKQGFQPTAYEARSTALMVVRGLDPMTSPGIIEVMGILFPD